MFCVALATWFIWIGESLQRAHKNKRGGERGTAGKEKSASVEWKGGQAERTVRVGSRQVASHSELIGRRSSLQFPPLSTPSRSLTLPHCHSKFKLNFHTLKLVGKLPNRHWIMTISVAADSLTALVKRAREEREREEKKTVLENGVKRKQN